MSRRESLVFVGLVSLAVAAVIRYAAWWLRYLPTYRDTSLAELLFHLLLYLALTFVIWHGIWVRLGHWYALACMRRVLWQRPRAGLRVAFLTCFVPGKEPLDVLEKTLRAMVRVRYPHDTWVLDEGGDPDVRRLCAELGVYHFSRKGIERYNQKRGKFAAKTKGGNQNAWRDDHEHEYDIIAQMDVDHVPRPDYLQRTLGYFRDPEVGFVLGPQIYGNHDESWIARGAAEQAFGFYGSYQRGYHGVGMALFIGTNHVYRVAAMRDIGGYAHGIVEDHLTGMHFFAAGWRGVYVPEVLSVGEGPVTWTDYLNQQMRWAYGLFEIVFHHSPKLLPRMRLKKALHYVFAQSYYFVGLAAALSVLLLWLYLFFGVAPTDMPLGEWLWHSAPVFVLTNAIYYWSQRFHVNPESERGLGCRGFVLNMGAIPIYFAALILAIFQRPLTYAVTPKGSAARSHRGEVVRPFFAHYLIVAATIEASFVGLSLGRSAWHLYAWGAFIVVAIGGSALTGLFGAGPEHSTQPEPAASAGRGGDVAAGDAEDTPCLLSSSHSRALPPNPPQAGSYQDGNRVYRRWRTTLTLVLLILGWVVLLRTPSRE